MVGISLFTVAICYFGSFAIANGSPAAKRTLREDLLLFEKLLEQGSEEKMKEEIQKVPNSNKEEVYKHIKEFHARIKEKCSIFANEIKENELSSVTISGDLLTQLKDMLKALEAKCKLIRGIALNELGDNTMLSKLEGSGIVKNGEGLRDNLNKRDLKRCYRSFFHDIYELESELGIVEHDKLSESDNDSDSDCFEEDESEHDDCGHPDHVSDPSRKPVMKITRLPGPDQKLEGPPLKERGPEPTGGLAVEQSQTSDSEAQTGDQNSRVTPGAENGVQNAEHSSSGRAPESAEERIAAPTQGPILPKPTATEGQQETPVSHPSTTVPDAVPTVSKPTQTEAEQEQRASDPPAAPAPDAVPSGSGSERPVQEQNNHIRKQQPAAGQQSQAYISLFATAVATVVVSVF